MSSLFQRTNSNDDKASELIRAQLEYRENGYYSRMEPDITEALTVTFRRVSLRRPLKNVKSKTFIEDIQSVCSEITLETRLRKTILINELLFSS